MVINKTASAKVILICIKFWKIAFSVTVSLTLCKYYVQKYNRTFMHIFKILKIFYDFFSELGAFNQEIDFSKNIHIESVRNVERWPKITSNILPCVWRCEIERSFYTLKKYLKTLYT